ncbi:MAG: ATP-dependent RNA helicase HrpA [Pseudomonadales bacterium]|nr:ATP-dependent RNA helicase HrpA [Pseudomonadales bacterium]
MDQVKHTELMRSLDHCMIRDRFRLQKALATARKHSTDQAHQQKKYAALELKVQKSLLLAQTRAEKLPVPEFPAQLPVSQRLDDLKQTISQNQVVIIAGETGSGKTTQLPKICLALGRGIFGVIGHTQPRRIAARTVAQRIAEELQVPFGESVGYQVRFTDKTTAHTHIKVMTDGILLAETQNDRFLEQYDTLIIDEAHERSLNIDFLLGYLKRILPRRPDLKVLITSATIDLQRFSEHFDNAPIVEVSGRTFPVDVEYRPLATGSRTDDSDNLVLQGVVETLYEIASREKAAAGKMPHQNDVLVFLPGEREIRELAELIRKSNLQQFDTLPLYSRLSVAEQNRVFQQRNRHKQRVVLATNVAETSLTVPGIRYVIDPGLARISRYSIRSKVQQLPVEPISRASADQRKGRCGRVSAGVCYRLYAEEDFLSRPEFTAPEILRTNLAAVILQMLNLQLGDVAQFPFVEKPEQRQINDGYHLLAELQAVNEHKKITRTGKNISRLAIDLKLARMILAAGQQGCLKEMLTITSVLALQDPRERPYEQQQAADQKHSQHNHEQSDFMALLNLWQNLTLNQKNLTNSQFRKFCRSHFISYIRFREWRENRRQLQQLCQQIKLKENTQEANYAQIHGALLTGLLGNIGQKTNDNEYLGARNRKFFIFPGSSQFKRKPRWLVSFELVETSRLFGRMVAQIDSDWIEPLARHLVKRNYHEAHFDPDRGQVMAYEEVILYGVVIINKRPVDYAQVDRAKARQLFIQSALVEQQLISKADFYIQNCALVADIETLESKSRKRDILVEPYAVYRFYDAQLPEDVASQKSLEAFRNKAEVAGPKLLFLSQDTLMKQQPDLSETLYPSNLNMADTRLKLDYHFDPQHEHDGVSLNVPLAILRQVSRAQLDWVIPGLLEEKCLALIKSLPKALRKRFVPAPDYAAKVAPQLSFDGRELSSVLAEKLFRISGIKVTAGDFNLGSIDQHLHMNIKVLDEKGQVIATGRNLSALVDQFEEQVSAEFNRRPGHSLEQQGLTEWNFGDLPEKIEFEQAGITLKGYPALIDKQDSVSIKILDNDSDAQLSSRQGLLRLIICNLAEEKKYIEKNIPGFDKFALFYATRGSRQELLDDLVAAIFRYTFIESIDGKTMVANAEEFQQRLQMKKHLVSHMNQVADLLKDILKRTLLIEDSLKNRRTEASKVSYKDIQGQMHQLLGGRFITRVPFEWLKHYPRFLQAIDHRMEKMPANFTKDRLSAEIIADFWQRLEIGSAGYVDLTGENSHFRWMIEELRVSLFAQRLKTSLPVSAKRLEKQWQKLAS